MAGQKRGSVGPVLPMPGTGTGPTLTPAAMAPFGGLDSGNLLLRAAFSVGYFSGFGCTAPILSDLLGALSLLSLGALGSMRVAAM